MSKLATYKQKKDKVIELVKENPTQVLIRFFIALLILLGVILLSVSVYRSYSERGCYFEKHIFTYDIVLLRVHD